MPYIFKEKIYPIKNILFGRWNLPESWLLRAQMVIGGIEVPAGEKAFEPVENRLKVFGA